MLFHLAAEGEQGKLDFTFPALTSTQPLLDSVWYVLAFHCLLTSVQHGTSCFTQTKERRGGKGEKNVPRLSCSPHTYIRRGPGFLLPSPPQSEVNRKKIHKQPPRTTATDNWAPIGSLHFTTSSISGPQNKCSSGLTSPLSPDEKTEAPQGQLRGSRAAPLGAGALVTSLCIGDPSWTDQNRSQFGRSQVRFQAQESPCERDTEGQRQESETEK